MGIETTLFVIAVILVLVFFYGSQINDYLNSFKSNYLLGVQAGTLKTIPKTGQSICTLKVHFDPILSSGLFSLNPPVQIPNGADQISWIGCQSSVVKYNLIPRMNQLIFNSNLLSFAQDFGSIPTDITFTAILVADDGTQLAPIINPTVIHMNNGANLNEQTFPLEFAFTKVPRQHYTLILSSSTNGINQQNAGNNYNQNIPAQ